LLAQLPQKRGVVARTRLEPAGERKPGDSSLHGRHAVLEVVGDPKDDGVARSTVRYFRERLRGALLADSQNSARVGLGAQVYADRESTLLELAVVVPAERLTRGRIDAVDPSPEHTDVRTVGYVANGPDELGRIQLPVQLRSERVRLHEPLGADALGGAALELGSRDLRRDPFDQR